MTKVRTSQLAQTGAVTGQAVVWNGTEWVPGGYDDTTKIPKALVDAKGDLILATAADVVARLPVGANGTALVADSATATGVKWATPTDTSKVPVALFDTKGDLIVGTGPDTYARLPAGTDGQVLRALAADPEGVEWDTLTASDVPFVPFGTIEATNVQSALEELSIEGGGGGGGGGGGHVIRDEGVTLAQRADLDFVGSGVTVTDDPGTGRTVVSVAGSSAAPFARTTVVHTTASLANGAQELSVVPIAPGYRLLRIYTNRPARVRLYDAIASRDADAGRSVAGDPAVVPGLMLDYVTEQGGGTASLNPLVDGFVVSGSDAPITVDNRGTPGAVSVTLTYVRTE